MREPNEYNGLSSSVFEDQLDCQIVSRRMLYIDTYMHTVRWLIDTETSLALWNISFAFEK